MMNIGKILALKKLIVQWVSLLALIKGPNYSAPYADVSGAIKPYAVLAEKLLLAP